MMRVAAGILRRDGLILACRRRLGDSFGGKWEFPGGKIRASETPSQALVRELQEELGILVHPGPEVECVRYEYPGHPPVEIRFFEIREFHQEPQNLCSDELRWLPPHELPTVDWLEADLPLVRRLVASDGQPLPPEGGSTEDMG